jgi:hypothetical protein
MVGIPSKMYGYVQSCVYLYASLSILEFAQYGKNSSAIIANVAYLLHK